MVMDLDRPLIMLDTETTGLDSTVHEVVELAYSAWDSENVRTLIVPHTLLHADPEALRINRYWERGLNYRSLWAQPEDFEQFRRDVSGATVLSANIVFDLGFLDRWISLDRHYRVMDFTSWAAGRLGWMATHGMERTAAECRARGMQFPLPDHTAAGDVRSMKAMYIGLLEEK